MITKLTLDRSVPSDLPYAVQHLTIEFDGPEDLDEAQRILDEWFERQVEALPPDVLSRLRASAAGPTSAPRPKNAPPSRGRGQQSGVPVGKSGGEYTPPPSVGNLSELTRRYEDAVSKFAELTGKKRTDFEYALVRAGTVWQTREGSLAGQGGIKSLYDLIERRKKSGKDPADSYMAHVVERIEQLVKALEFDGHVRLNYKAWDRASRKEYWTSRDYSVGPEADAFHPSHPASPGEQPQEPEEGERTPTPEDLDDIFGEDGVPY